MDLSMVLAFAVAAFVISVVPGPDMMFISGRTALTCPYGVNDLVRPSTGRMGKKRDSLGRVRHRSGLEHLV
jgi:hypothetical protein